MNMRRPSAPPTDTELRRQFEWALEQALQGTGRTGLALDSTVQDALLAVMDSAPDVPADLVAAARTAFAGQLSGANHRSRDAELENLFRQSRQSA
ncbi:hypothetical protein [Nocardia sp. NPDC051833]|uniref:hypothetical protein n=1 Tax=Nocardia sp. NPDC051833 TaxID=3155674 RepID=UPI00343F40C6